MCKNVDLDSSTVCVDLCVSVRRRLSAVFVPGAEKLRRTSNQPAALLDSGAARPLADSSLPSFSGEAGRTPEAKGRTAVVIERSSSGGMWRPCWNLSVPAPASSSLQREREGRRGQGSGWHQSCLWQCCRVGGPETGIIIPAETFLTPAPPRFPQGCHKFAFFPPIPNPQ